MPNGNPIKKQKRKSANKKTAKNGKQGTETEGKALPLSAQRDHAVESIAPLGASNATVLCKIQVPSVFMKGANAARYKQ